MQRGGTYYAGHRTVFTCLANWIFHQLGSPSIVDSYPLAISGRGTFRNDETDHDAAMAMSKGPSILQTCSLSRCATLLFLALNA